MLLNCIGTATSIQCQRACSIHLTHLRDDGSAQIEDSGVIMTTEQNFSWRWTPRGLGAAGLVLLVGVTSCGVAACQPAPVAIPDRSFPESLTSTRDGTLYVGSLNLGGVVKI